MHELLRNSILVLNFRFVCRFCPPVHFPQVKRACFKRNVRWETVTSVQLTFPDTHACDISFEWNITPFLNQTVKGQNITKRTTVWEKQTDVLDLFKVFEGFFSNPKANSRALFHLGMYYSFRLMNTFGVSAIRSTFYQSNVLDFAPCFYHCLKPLFHHLRQASDQKSFISTGEQYRSCVEVFDSIWALDVLKYLRSDLMWCILTKTIEIGEGTKKQSENYQYFSTETWISKHRFCKIGGYE